MPAELQLPDTVTILVRILQAELHLDSSRVVMGNQRWKMPNDDGIFLAVNFLASRAFGNSKRYQDGEKGLEEVQSLNMQEHFTINIASQGDQAFARKEEILFAFGSDTAQQAAEKYAVKFGTLPKSFIDISSVEGTAKVNRYALTFHLLRAYERVRLVEYFNQFEIPPKELVINP